MSIILDSISQQNAEDIGGACDSRSDKWEYAFSLVLKFKQREGHCNVPSRHIEDGIHLGDWLQYQKRRKRSGRLDPIHRQRLTAIGVAWKGQLTQWECAFSLLVQFKNREGHCDVKQRHKENGLNLGVWLKYQKKKKKLGDLGPTYQHRLEDIGVRWEDITNRGKKTVYLSQELNRCSKKNVEDVEPINQHILEDFRSKWKNCKTREQKSSFLLLDLSRALTAPGR